MTYEITCSVCSKLGHEINTSPEKFSDLEKFLRVREEEAMVELVTANEHDAAQMLVRSLVNDVVAGQI